MAFGRFGSVGAGFGRLGTGGGVVNPWTPVTLVTNVMNPVGKVTWNSGTKTVALVGALAAESVAINFTPFATAGATYRIMFNVTILAGDSFSFRCGGTLAGQISTTGAKTFDLVAGGGLIFDIIEWGGTLTDLTLTNVQVYLHA